MTLPRSTQMAHSQIFSQWRQPTNECYPSQRQQQHTYQWTQHVGGDRDEERRRSHLYQLQQCSNPWQSSQWQNHQSQQEFQQRWQNAPQVQPNQLEHNQQDRQERFVLQEHWPALHNPSWQHRYQRHSTVWQQHRPSTANRELSFLDTNSRTSGHGHSSQSWHDNFEAFVNDINYVQRKNTGMIREQFEDDAETITEGREQYKRKNSEMKDISEGYDTDDEEILPSCKRQRITVAAVERLLASFTISDNRTEQDGNIHSEDHLQGNDSTRQGDTSSLQADKYYEAQNNLHSANSIPHANKTPIKEIPQLQNGIATGKLTHHQDASKENSPRGIPSNDTIECQVAYKSPSPHQVFNGLVDCDSDSCTLKFKAEPQLLEATDRLRQFEEGHPDSDRPLLMAPVLNDGLSHTGNEVAIGEIAQLAGNCLKTISRVKVTFPDEEEEQEVQGTEEEKDKKEDDEETRGYVLNASENESENGTEVERVLIDKDIFHIQQQQGTIYSRWEKKDAHESYKQEFQNNENDLRNNLCNSSNPNNVGNENSIPERNYDLNGHATEDISNISDVNNSARNSSYNTKILDIDISSTEKTNFVDTTRDPSSADYTNTSHDTNTSHNINTSQNTNTSHDPNTSHDTNTSHNTNPSHNTYTNQNINTSHNTYTSDSTTPSSKRSMDGGEATPADEGSSQKRVRKLKSGLRLCSNITCYIEQVLYNC